MNRSYNLIAPIYDTIAALIFGTALRKAQIHFLPFLSSNANILIAGGGTGWILEEIVAIHPQGLCIDYVDVSAKMIAIAKQRNIGNNKVNFIHQSIFSFTGNQLYDVIITPFFFDNFKEETVQQAFVILHQQLKGNGLWLYTDFRINHASPLWQKALLFLMYKFFRIAANIEAERLPNVASCFSQHPYQRVEAQTFFHHFISTTLYKKSQS